MPYTPLVHHRRSNRLKGYDYSLAGVYFVTLVTWHRDLLFGRIHGNKVDLSDMGKIINVCWLRLTNSFNVHLDEWVIMPNHFHGILWIKDSSKGEATAYRDYHQFQLSRQLLRPNKARSVLSLGH